MTVPKKQVLVCNCEVTMALDGKRLAELLPSELGGDQPIEVCTQLCRAQLSRFKDAVGNDETVLVGCTQEAPLFEETKAELRPDSSTAYVNIRERAGWSEESGKALPKIAALINEAALDIPMTSSVSMETAGQCLIYGAGQQALDAALQLSSRLAVTLLFTDEADALPPRQVAMPVFKGKITKATGHLGRFRLTVDGFSDVVVSSRERLSFGSSRDAIEAEAELILDLTGGAPLFPAHKKRDGYYRPDPGDPAAVQRALYDVTDMVGEFEKPRYVDFTSDLCAHSRNQKTGCTRCLDVCPAAAIRPDGDAVAIDPFLCGGCGACHSVCPTGAASYAFPPAASIVERLRTLLGSYLKAGGERPVLLIHDETYGLDILGVLARIGRGLPANVIPFALHEVTQLGLEAILGAFAYGAERLVFLIPPSRQDELVGLKQQMSYAETILGGLGYGGDDRLRCLVESDPSVIEDMLWALDPLHPLASGDYLPLGQKRSLLRSALDTLFESAPTSPARITLPAGAPFGCVNVDIEGCTLCLACVGVCPTGALTDNPETPALRFQEDACVQCGLCANTCPESVIALEPGVSFEDAARQPSVVKQEEPFLCIRCQKPFGTRSSIEKIVALLGEKHSMFRDNTAIDRIRMCDDCRVVVQFEAADNPMAGPAKRPVRTTDDYLREREEIDAARRRAKDEG
ncbi:MAG: 4Fe-4S binding protein [Pseudomonadota bacterium]